MRAALNVTSRYVQKRGMEAQVKLLPVGGPGKGRCGGLRQQRNPLCHLYFPLATRLPRVAERQLDIVGLVLRSTLTRVHHVLWI